MLSYINTTEVENISREIIDLSTELKNELNNLFTRFSDVPYVSKEWVGSQSVYYFNKVLEEKKKYMDFADALKNIGYKLSKDIYEINTCVKKNNDEEIKKGS